jgi:hypothetical protein
LFCKAGVASRAWAEGEQILEEDGRIGRFDGLPVIDIGRVPAVKRRPGEEVEQDLERIGEVVFVGWKKFSGGASIFLAKTAMGI